MTILLNLYTPSYQEILTNRQLNPMVNACNYLSKLISSGSPPESPPDLLPNLLRSPSGGDLGGDLGGDRRRKVALIP